MGRLWPAVLCVAMLGLTALAQEKPGGSKPGQVKSDKPPIAPTAETLRLRLPYDPADKALHRDLGAIGLLRTGDPESKPPEEDRRQLLQRIAQYYIFRLTHEVPLYTTTTGPDSLREHVGTFAGRVLPFARMLDADPNVPAEQTTRIRRYASELAEVCVPLFLKVLQDPRPIVRINAMRMAFLFAERGIGEIHPVLMYTLEKYPIDAAAVFQAERYWAIRGFGELFHALATNQDPKRIILSHDITIKAAELIYKWLDWAYHIDPKQVRLWSAEEQDGLRYLRRQAVRSLGLLRRPVVNPANPKAQRIAELLWQIIHEETAAKMSPPPSWSERVEAAAALLALLPEPKGPYQADWAFYEVGRFAVDLIRRAEADQEGREAWQHYAAYLRSRLLEVQQHPAYAKFDYCKKLIPLMVKPLEEVSRVRPQDAGKRVNTQDLEKFLDKNLPKAKELFTQARSQP